MREIHRTENAYILKCKNVNCGYKTLATRPTKAKLTLTCHKCGEKTLDFVIIPIDIEE